MGRMRTRLCSIVLVTGYAVFGMLNGTAHAAAISEPSVYVSLISFNWKEFDDVGTRRVTESGPLIGIGFLYEYVSEKGIALRPRTEIFGGVVDYDGYACNVFTGACVPAKTDTRYFGMLLQADLGKRFMASEAFSLEPFAGAGYRLWFRDIKDTAFASGGEEFWLRFYLRFGLRAGIDLAGGKRMYVEGGTFVPFYTENNTPDVTLQPGNTPSYFAEAGMKVDNVKISVFYEGMRYPKSDLEANGAFVFWQPRSEEDVVGIRVGYIF